MTHTRFENEELTHPRSRQRGGRAGARRSIARSASGDSAASASDSAAQSATERATTTPAARPSTPSVPTIATAADSSSKPSAQADAGSADTESSAPRNVDSVLDEGRVIATERGAQASSNADTYTGTEPSALPREPGLASPCVSSDSRCCGHENASAAPAIQADSSGKPSTSFAAAHPPLAEPISEPVEPHRMAHLPPYGSPPSSGAPEADSDTSQPGLAAHSSSDSDEAPPRDPPTHPSTSPWTAVGCKFTATDAHCAFFATDNATIAPGDSLSISLRSRPDGRVTDASLSISPVGSADPTYGDVTLRVARAALAFTQFECAHSVATRRAVIAHANAAGGFPESPPHRPSDAPASLDKRITDLESSSQQLASLSAMDERLAGVASTHAASLADIDKRLAITASDIRGALEQSSAAHATSLAALDARLSDAIRSSQHQNVDLEADTAANLHGIAEAVDELKDEQAAQAAASLAAHATLKAIIETSDESTRADISGLEIQIRTMSESVVDTVEFEQRTLLQDNKLRTLEANLDQLRRAESQSARLSAAIRKIDALEGNVSSLEQAVDSDALTHINDRLHELKSLTPASVESLLNLVTPAANDEYQQLCADVEDQQTRFDAIEASSAEHGAVAYGLASRIDELESNTAARIAVIEHRANVEAAGLTAVDISHIRDRVSALDASFATLTARCNHVEKAVLACDNRQRELLAMIPRLAHLETNMRVIVKNLGMHASPSPSMLAASPSSYSPYQQAPPDQHVGGGITPQPAAASPDVKASDGNIRAQARGGEASMGPMPTPHAGSTRPVLPTISPNAQLVPLEVNPDTMLATTADSVTESVAEIDKPSKSAPPPSEDEDAPSTSDDEDAPPPTAQSAEQQASRGSSTCAHASRTAAAQRVSQRSKKPTAKAAAAKASAAKASTTKAAKALAAKESSAKSGPNG